MRNINYFCSEMKPVLAEWIFMWLESHHVGGISKKEIIKFLLEGATQQNNGDLASRIESMLTSNHKKLLNLSRDWLDSFLPHVLQKIDRVR